jgi:hypothetical protein
MASQYHRLPPHIPAPQPPVDARGHHQRRQGGAGEDRPEGAWPFSQLPALAAREDSPALFVGETGQAIRYCGGRRSFGASRSARAPNVGASIADIHDVLGHESDVARHCAGRGPRVAAANLMPKYSLAS